MISLRCWLDFTRPPPYSPRGQPPSDEKYLHDTAKYWFGGIEALNKFTSLRKPSNMSSTDSAKSISLMDPGPTSPLSDTDDAVEQEPLMPGPAAYPTPSSSDAGRPEDSGLTIYVDLIGFIRVLCFSLALAALFAFSVAAGSRLNRTIKDWVGAYVAYWLAMAWSFGAAIYKLFGANLPRTRVRVAVNNREYSLCGLDKNPSTSDAGRLFRMFCLSVIDLVLGILVIVYTAGAGLRMQDCHRSRWHCRATHFNPAVTGLASALGAIMIITAFLTPFPALVSRYIRIRMSFGSVSRKVSDDGDIYLP